MIKKIIFSIWILLVIGWNYGVPGATPFEDVFVARAFKPLKNILHFLDQKAENWKKIFLFLGKNGKNELLQASKSWDIKYKQRMSVSSSDSIVIEINRLKKK